MNEYVFQRKENKYILNKCQYKEMREFLDSIVIEDMSGPIFNVYFDTPDFLLIRRSIEHPVYKEKLRLRCYGVPADDSPAFIEIKKKYKGISNKRRIELPYWEARKYLYDKEPLKMPGQIGKEIDYLVRFYGPMVPAMGIAYNRLAFFEADNPALRITFDNNIRWTTEELAPHVGNHGKLILPPEQYIMEIKTNGPIKLELAHALNDLKIFKSAISKYGCAYKQYKETHNGYHL